MRAHLAAADRLAPGAPHAGKAYFVAQKEPVVLWEWLASLLGRLGIPPPTRRVPLAVAYSAGASTSRTVAGVFRTFFVTT